MKISQSWSRLRRRSTAALRRTTDRALVRQLREELFAGSPYLRPRLEAAGYDPGRFRGQRDLAGLPTSDLPSLRDVPARQLVLRPPPGAMREHWPFSRKLALVLAGGRAAQLLEQAYQPVLATEEQGLAVTWTHTDLELAAELGARVLDLCGLGPGDQLDSELRDQPCFEHMMLARGAQRAGVELAPGGTAVALPVEGALEALERRDPTELRLLLLFGPPPEAATRRALAVRLAPGTRLATCWTCGPVRMALVEEPAAPTEEPGGLVLFPDLVAAERQATGELVLTNLGSHGTALLRFHTGALVAGIDWTPSPRSGLRLPRVCELEA